MTLTERMAAITPAAKIQYHNRVVRSQVVIDQIRHEIDEAELAEEVA